MSDNNYYNHSDAVPGCDGWTECRNFPISIMCQYTDTQLQKPINSVRCMHTHTHTNYSLF